MLHWKYWKVVFLLVCPENHGPSEPSKNWGILFVCFLRRVLDWISSCHQWRLRSKGWCLGWYVFGCQASTAWHISGLLDVVRTVRPTNFTENKNTALKKGETRSIYEKNLGRPMLRGYVVSMIFFNEGEPHLEKQLMFCSSGTTPGSVLPSPKRSPCHRLNTNIRSTKKSRCCTSYVLKQQQQQQHSLGSFLVLPYLCAGPCSHRGTGHMPIPRGESGISSPWSWRKTKVSQQQSSSYSKTVDPKAKPKE